jgi:hypothetical protein
MKVFGVSQSSGAERRLYVERGADGIVLALADKSGKEMARVLVPIDDILATATHPVPGGSTVTGVSPSHGTKIVLRVEVRRNEVWLEVQTAGGSAADVAVGLDDFQDALEAAVHHG